MDIDRRTVKKVMGLRSKGLTWNKIMDQLGQPRAFVLAVRPLMKEVDPNSVADLGPGPRLSLGLELGSFRHAFTSDSRRTTSPRCTVVCSPVDKLLSTTLPAPSSLSPTVMTQVACSRSAILNCALAERPPESISAGIPAARSSRRRCQL